MSSEKLERKIFGTDGIRGEANRYPMDAETALKVAIATSRRFLNGGHRHRVVIGKDTRLSGYMIEPALVAGFTSIGMDVVLLGPLPTPGVAMLTTSMKADLGVMISASHNPYKDNGIKFFRPDGSKLSDAIEAEIEESMRVGGPLATYDRLGRARRIEDAQGRYIEFVKATFPKRQTLEGFKIVIDCANGAAYKVAPTVLEELGAEVIAIGVNPDGFNINANCGATDPKLLAQEVLKHRADLGIALDGDADRVILVDERGRIIDGDQLIAAMTVWLLAQGRLKEKTVVATVMSNLGLERFLRSKGVTLLRTHVGDRYVAECMRKENLNLGGEQSGHIILSDYTTTGDGLIAALQALAIMKSDDLLASVALKFFKPVPQLLRNVRYEGGDPLESLAVKNAINTAGSVLGEKGRVLVRKSGTEKLIRVMVEGDDRNVISETADSIVEAINAATKVEA